MEEILHSKGPWKNHSYVRKIKKNGAWVYIYGSDDGSSLPTRGLVSRKKRIAEGSASVSRRDDVKSSSHGFTSRKKRIAEGSATVFKREKATSSISRYGLTSRKKRIAEGSASVVRRKKVTASSAETRTLGKNAVDSILKKIGKKSFS